MRAWAVVENGKPLQEIELPTPEPKGTEVLLEVTHCGVCHSDLHIWEGYYDVGGGQKMSLNDRGVTLPLAMGHEIVGRVVKLGPDAKGVKAGDIRIVYPLARLRQVRDLPRRRRQHVRRRRPQPGRLRRTAATAPMSSPRIRGIWSIPATLDPAVAATYACSGITVYSAIKKAMPVPPHEAIVLVGAGGLGLNAITVLHGAEAPEHHLGRHQRGEARRRAEGRRHKVVDGNGDGRDEAHHRGRGRPGPGGDRPGQRHRRPRASPSARCARAAS